MSHTFGKATDRYINKKIIEEILPTVVYTFVFVF